MLQYLKIIYSGMNCEEDNYLKKSLLRPHFWEISDQGTDFPKVNLLDIRKFLKQYTTNKDILNLCIRKDIGVSVNKDSMNKNSFKNVIFRF